MRFTFSIFYFIINGTKELQYENFIDAHSVYFEQGHPLHYISLVSIHFLPLQTVFDGFHSAIFIHTHVVYSEPLHLQEPSVIHPLLSLILLYTGTPLYIHYYYYYFRFHI
jgi:hypothetical protein